MNPTLEQLARYVTQELERGVPEITLYNSLRESGWTPDWISAAFSAAKQRAMPRGNDMNIPPVQQTLSSGIPAVQPFPQSKQVNRQRAVHPSVSLAAIRKSLVILVAILGLILVGVGTFRVLEAFDRAAALRVSRDASRREDLSILLNNLSDYYIAHKSYPTRNQLNTKTFLEQNNFNEDSITDPSWAADNAGCAQNARPQLAAARTPSCYVYEVTGAHKSVCNNDLVPCTKVTVTIPLEVEKKSYSVTFDQNRQVES